MRVIVIAADYSSDLVHQYLRECESGWSGPDGVKCFEPKDGPPARPIANAPETDRFIMSDYTDEDGRFASVRMVKELANRIGTASPVLVLDSTTGTTRYSDLDRHGMRAAEIPGLIAKTLYWMPEPPTVVHFVQSTMKPFYMREWSLVVEYAPAESPYVAGHDVAAVRIDPIRQRALARRTIYSPRERVKRFLHRTLFRPVAKLVPRFRFFR